MLLRITKRIALVLTICLLFQHLLPASDYAFFQKLYYEDITGSVIIKGIRWIEKDSTGYTFKYSKTNGSYYETIVDSQFNTLWWRMVRCNDSTDVTVSRKGDLFVKKGVFCGKKVFKQKSSDPMPWLETIDFSLLPFIFSDKDKITFLIVRPTDLKNGKVVAKKVGIEKVTVRGKTYETVKVRVTLPNLFSFIWSSWYWFRLEDGVPVRHITRRGGPGTPKSIIELVCEENCLEIQNRDTFFTPPE
jgi:hypothetical protein